MTKKKLIYVLIFLVGIGYFFTSSRKKISSRTLESNSSATEASPAPSRNTDNDKAPLKTREPNAVHFNKTGKDLNPDDVLRELESRWKTTLTLTRTSKGMPFRLSGNMKLKNSTTSGQKNGTDYESIADFLQTIAPTLNIDHPEQLPKPNSQQGTLGEIVNFAQEYEGVTVEGAQVRVHLDGNGNPFMVNSSYQSGLNAGDINMTPAVSAEEALGIAINNARTLDPNLSEPGHNPPPTRGPTQVIYKFKSTNTSDLAWKVYVSQPWLGAAHGIGIYFVDAHHASQWERIEGAVE